MYRKLLIQQTAVVIRSNGMRSRPMRHLFYSINNDLSVRHLSNSNMLSSAWKTVESTGLASSNILACTVPDQIVKNTSYGESIVTSIQSIIESIHTTTGLPWWAALTVTGFTFRAALFPLYLYQIKASQRLVIARPAISHLYSAYKYAAKFLPRQDIARQIQALILGRKGLKLLAQKYNAHPMKAVIGSLLHIPFFFFVAYSIRDIVRSGTITGLEAGGFLYWINLTVPDETFVLPILASLATYVNFELGFKDRSKFFQGITRYAQYVPIIALPIVATLPQGVFYYWISSSTAGMLQTLMLRKNWVRAYLGLGPKLNSSTKSLNK